MAGYEPKEWKCGDTITADDLNHMEQGIADGGGGSALIVTKNDNVLDKTWQEIYDAFVGGRIILIHTNDTSAYELVTLVAGDAEGGYTVNGYRADNPNDYPVEEGQ